MNSAADLSALLEVRQIYKEFPLAGALPILPSRARVRAVNNVSFRIWPREILSIVGESGCGKTTLAKLVLLLERPTRGTIVSRGMDITRLKGRALKQYRSSVQYVSQDPWSSLNPRRRIRDIIGEPLLVNKGLRGRALSDAVGGLLESVGLEQAMVSSFPHELSGGMRQRVAIARALALRPSLVVLDEPVSALDVSIRAQIMNLLQDLQAQYGIAYLLISHNLASVRHLSHRVLVMYLGEVVESARSEDLFDRPLHPYTQALLSAAAPVRPNQQHEEIILSGEVPSPTAPPPGCAFHTRCPSAFDRCKVEVPASRQVSLQHEVACHRYDGWNPASDATKAADVTWISELDKSMA